MKISHWAAAALSVACIATAHAQFNQKDHEFLVEAAGANLYEIEAGKTALGMAKSGEVRSFGSMLVKDHEAANQKLKELAQRKSMAIPTAIPKDKQIKLDYLVASENFDRDFVKEVGLQDHAADIALFEKFSQQAQDSDIRAFATETLPELKAHRSQAEQLQKSLRK